MSSVTAPQRAWQALGGLDVAGADGVACQRWLGDIRRVRGYLDAVEAAVLSRVDVLAAGGESFGAADTSVRCSGVSSREAGKLTDRSKTLDQVAGFGNALAAGDVTAEHVDKLAAVAGTLSDELRETLFERSGELLEHAVAHDPGRFGRHVRDLARGLECDAGISRDRQQRDNTYVSWKVAADGMYDVHARLHPLAGNRLVRALDAEIAARVAAGEAAGDPDCVERTVNRGRLAAEVLVDFVCGQHQQVRPALAEISVLVDADTLSTGEIGEGSVCETSHGAPLAVDSVRALLCSGMITPVIVGQHGVVLDIGRTARFPNRAQRRALRAMYRSCAAAGCEVGFDRCELHHIVPWEHGGPTDLANLVPVCSRHHHHHHHQIHTLGWQLDLAADRAVTIRDRHGHIVMITTPDMPHLGHRSRRRTQPAPADHPPDHHRHAS